MEKNSNYRSEGIVVTVPIVVYRQYNILKVVREKCHCVCANNHDVTMYMKCYDDCFY